MIHDLPLTANRSVNMLTSNLLQLGILHLHQVLGRKVKSAVQRRVLR